MVGRRARLGIVVLAGGLFAAAPLAHAQQGSTKDMKVAIEGENLVLHCTTNVKGMKDAEVRFTCQLMREGAPVKDGSVSVTATPSYDDSTWNDDSYELKAAPIYAALGPGRHPLTAVVTITNAASGAALGSDETQFVLTVPGTPASKQPRADVGELTVDPEARTAEGPMIRVQGRIEINGLKDQEVRLVCRLERRGRPVPGVVREDTVRPRFVGTVWKTYAFHLSRAQVDAAIGAGAADLMAVVQVFAPGDRLIGGRRSVPFRIEVAEPEPPPSAEPPPVADAADAADADDAAEEAPLGETASLLGGVTSADLRALMVRSAERLRPHPAGVPGLGFDPRLAGTWTAVTPLLDPNVLRDYARGARDDLRGLYVRLRFTLRPDGTGEVEQVPLKVVLEGRLAGRMLEVPGARTTPVSRWGIQVDSDGTTPFCLLRLDMPGGFERGLCVVDPTEDAPAAFRYTYFRELSQRFHDQTLVFARQPKDLGKEPGVEAANIELLRITAQWRDQGGPPDVQALGRQRATMVAVLERAAQRSLVER